MDLFFEKLERFKILIRQGWDLNCVSDSKALKLKLNKSIQHEHGNKMLVKNVNNLYFDELNGMKNILCDLNNDGFPLLKYLILQNNAKINYIAVSLTNLICAFPNLDSLFVYNLISLEHICHGPLTGESFSKLKCEKLVTVFPASIMRNLRNLETVMVNSCCSVEVVENMNQYLLLEFFFFFYSFLKHYQNSYCFEF